jgi:hypothetical protein
MSAEDSFLPKTIKTLHSGISPQFSLGDDEIYLSML